MIHRRKQERLFLGRHSVQRVKTFCFFTFCNANSAWSCNTRPLGSLHRPLARLWGSAIGHPWQWMWGQCHPGLWKGPADHITGAGWVVQFKYGRHFWIDPPNGPPAPPCSCRSPSVTEGGQYTLAGHDGPMVVSLFDCAKHFYDFYNRAL